MHSQKRLLQCEGAEFCPRQIDPSGLTRSTDLTFASLREGIHAVIPLPDLTARLIDENTVQVTYDSAATYGGVVEHAHITQ